MWVVLIDQTYADGLARIPTGLRELFRYLTDLNRRQVLDARFQNADLQGLSAHAVKRDPGLSTRMTRDQVEILCVA